jgi:hypothetical protein
MGTVLILMSSVFVLDCKVEQLPEGVHNDALEMAA